MKGGEEGGKGKTKIRMLGRKNTISQVLRQQIPWIMPAQPRQGLAWLDCKDQDQSREGLAGHARKEQSQSHIALCIHLSLWAPTFIQQIFNE